MVAGASLLLDEDVRPLLAVVLRQRGLDAVHVLGVGRGGCSDEDQLRFATEHGRAISTHNIKDFLLLDKQWRAQGLTHQGILMSDQVTFRELLSRTLKCLNRYSARDLRELVVWLHTFK
jgi:predicted nuclease of predicted toxin-antitoxin system